MPKSFHHAFRLESNGGVFRQLICPVGICAADAAGVMTTPAAQITMLWDTGAGSSVITPEVVAQLGLVQIGQRTVGAAGASHVAKTYFVDLFLPMGVRIPNIEVCALSIPGGMQGLIGMDVISAGDFSISNFEGRTVFTYAIPSFENRTDLLEEANAVNKRK